MKLSVIIVNYNTQYFIQLCLHSVFRAIEGMDAEVIVVDNCSLDHSCQIIEKQFPQVLLIRNLHNDGFAKANNLGIAKSHGEYVLLLNPDVVIPEDCFKKCIAYLNVHGQFGALGIKMIDGSGQFLPESKRGLPTPLVAFFKMSGLIKLFPRSAKVAKYYHGDVTMDSISQVEVLTGAFFMARKQAGDALTWLDEEYFMYGEDIDLSYRFTKAGHPLVYFPKTFMVHFKGESSKDIDHAYIQNFFGTMELFYRKHFSHQYGKLFRASIILGIKLKSALTQVTKRFALKKVSSAAHHGSDFVLFAKDEETVKQFKILVSKGQISTSSPKEVLPKDLCNKNVVCTADYAWKEQLEVMMLVGNENFDVQFHFMSPFGDFVLSSPSKKWNGSIRLKNKGQ